MWLNTDTIRIRIGAKIRSFIADDEAVNILGLSIGLASAILIFLSVRFELSFDRFHPASGRIFRVVGESINPYETFHRARTPNPLGPAMKRDFPEVEEAVRLAKLSGILIEAEGQSFYEEKFFLADASFFEIFPFDFLVGEPQSAFLHPNSIVLTDSMAKK